MEGDGLTLGTGPILAAMENGNVDILKTLLEFWHNPEMGHDIAAVAERGDSSFLRLVLEKGAELNFPVD